MLQLLDQALDLVQQRLDLRGGAAHRGAGRAVHPVALAGDGGGAGVQHGLQGEFGLVAGEGGVLRAGHGRGGVGQRECGRGHAFVGEVADLGEQGAGSGLGLLDALLAAGEPVLGVAVALLAAGQPALRVEVALLALGQPGLGRLGPQLTAGQALFGVLRPVAGTPAGSRQDTGCRYRRGTDGRRCEQLDLRHRSPRSNGGSGRRRAGGARQGRC